MAVCSEIGAGDINGSVIIKSAFFFEDQHLRMNDGLLV